MKYEFDVDHEEEQQKPKRKSRAKVKDKKPATITIKCSKPGFIRFGRAWPAVEVIGPNDLTPMQLGSLDLNHLFTIEK